MSRQRGAGVRVTGWVESVLKYPDQRSGKKVPDQAEWTPNRQEERSVNVMELRMEGILT